MKAVPLLCVGFLLVGSAVLANRHDPGNYSTSTKEDMTSNRETPSDRYEAYGTDFAVNEQNDPDAWNRLNAERDPAYNASAFAAGRDRDDYDYWYDREEADHALTMREMEEGNGTYANASMEDRDRDEDAYEPAEWVDRSAERTDRDRKHDAVYLGWNADSRYTEHHPSREIPAHVDPRASEYSWPATDLDNDGIYDRLDRCPNTKPDVAVDACGCPMETTTDKDIVSVAAYPPGSHGNVEMAILRRGTFSLDMAFFDTDRSDLRPEAENALRQVAEIIRGYPTLKFQVGGHADSRGTEDHNQDLSEARADAVRNFLVWQCGVRDLQLSTHGYGERHLSTAERDGDELQANRRVDFRVVNPEAIPRGTRPVRMGTMETLSAQRMAPSRAQERQTAMDRDRDDRDDRDAVADYRPAKHHRRTVHREYALSNHREQQVAVRR